MRLRMTNFGIVSRQLSVLLSVTLSLPAQGQVNSATRDATETIPAATAGVPTYDAKKTMLVAKQVVLTDAGGDDKKFRRFYVRPDLSFGVQYTYDIHFNFSASDVRGNARPIPDGYYQVTVASFLKDGSDINNPGRVTPGETLADRFITRSAPTYIPVTNGEADGTISLRFDNPTLAALENTLYVEFVPLKNECARGRQKYPCLNFKTNGELDETKSEVIARDDVFPYLMNMNFQPYAKANSGRKNSDISSFSREIMQVGLNAFTTRALSARLAAERRANRAPISPVQYAANNNLSLISLNDSKLNDSARRWLRGGDLTKLIRQALYATDTGPIHSTLLTQTLQNVFCQFMADRVMPLGSLTGPAALVSPAKTQLEAQIATCQQGRDVSVDIRRVQHVGRVTGTLLQREQSSLARYVLMNNFTTSRSHEESSTQTFNFKPFSAIIKAIDPLGIVPFDYAQNISIGNTRSTSQTAGTSAQEYMDVNTVVLTIPTVNSRACLDVTLTSRSGTFLLDYRKGSRQGFYLCDDVQPKMDVHEFYMHAFSRMTDSSLADGHDRLTQSFNKALRGDLNLAAFYYSTRKGLSPEREEQLPSWYGAQASRYFADAPLPQPGLVITPVTSERGEVPSYFDMLILNPGYNEKFNPAFSRATTHP